MSLKNFEDTPQYKKGKIGEEIVKNMLKQKGWITYAPEGGPHYFDILATKDKSSVIAIDVKTKARFNKWAAQGIDTRHYEQYMNFVKNTSVPFFLIFVDDKNGEIHAANIAHLKNGFHPAKNIIAWPLSQMKKIGHIQDKNLIDKMGQFDTRKYKYNPEEENLLLF